MSFNESREYFATSASAESRVTRPYRHSTNKKPNSVRNSILTTLNVTLE